MIVQSRSFVASTTVAIVLLALTGCVAEPGSPGATGGSGTSTSADASPGSSGSTPGDSPTPDDPYSERDDFFREQQLPTDGTPALAVTATQKEFIAQQRSRVEAQGAPWTSSDESVALALATEACEASILSKHQVTATTLREHVASSPLFLQLIPADAEGEERRQAEAPIADVMVFGTTFLCPEDGAKWEAAYREVYGG